MPGRSWEAEMAKYRHLNDFTHRAGTTPVPKYYADALVALAQDNPNIVSLTGDVAPAPESDVFRNRFLEHFSTPAFAEANTVGMAAGMARCGDMPFVHSFSVFLIRRGVDQVAMQIAYSLLNVKLVGFLPGLTTLLGASQQVVDDLVLMWALPNMTIIEPSGACQIEAALRALPHSTDPFIC